MKRTGEKSGRKRKGKTGREGTSRGGGGGGGNLSMTVMFIFHTIQHLRHKFTSVDTLTHCKLGLTEAPERIRGKGYTINKNTQIFIPVGIISSMIMTRT